MSSLRLDVLGRAHIVYEFVSYEYWSYELIAHIEYVFFRKFYLIYSFIHCRRTNVNEIRTSSDCFRTYTYEQIAPSLRAHIVFGKSGSFMRVRTSSHESNSYENAFNVRAA